MNLTLGDIATLLSVGTVLFGGALAFIMSKAGNTFAASKDLAEMDARLGGRLRAIEAEGEDRLRHIETELARTVKHDEIGLLFDRLRLVETGVAVSNQALADVTKGIGRLEHQMNLIVQAQLEREKAATPRRHGASA
jgi:hypothetical protein